MSSSGQEVYCPTCGNPVILPGEYGVAVKCPRCKTVFSWAEEGLNEGAPDRKDVSGGIPLTCSPQKLHQAVLMALGSSACMPRDALEESEVVKEEHLCIPAYLFCCTSSGNVHYEAGNERERQIVRTDIFDGVTTDTQKYVEWTQMSSTISSTLTLAASGSKDAAGIVSRLYGDCSGMDLTGIDELEFPDDIKSYAWDSPGASSFSENCRPLIEEDLIAKADQMLAGEAHRNARLAGTDIRKDEGTRVLLGTYRIIFAYKGQEYAVYVTGDGRNYLCREAPVDAMRQAQMQDLWAQHDAVPQQSIRLAWPIALLVFGLLVSCGAGIPRAIFSGACIVGAIALFVWRHMKNVSYDMERERIADEYNAIYYEGQKLVRDFLDSGRRLKGIYSLN